MNKKLSMLLPVIATCGLLAGCGTDYYTKDSTVFVAINGSVVSTDVEDFDTAAYRQDDLQSYVDKSIDDYNKKNDGSVKLKKLTVEKKKASLTMSYASTDEYSDFNGTRLFSDDSHFFALPSSIAAKSVLKSYPAAKASAIVPEKSLVPLKSEYSSVDA